MTNRGTIRVAIMMLAAWAGTAHAQSTIVLPRAGQVGLGAGGGYAGMASSGNVGDTFGSGPFLWARLRYRMRYDRAVALAFENQRLDARRAAPPFDPAFPDRVAPTRLSVVLSGFEFYQMFGTRQRTVRMLMVGAGLAQLRASMNSGETQVLGFPWAGDGLYVSAGAGVERFFYRSWAFDLSARYHAIFREGKPNHDVQAALGVIIYASQ